ncbi:MAG: hypothetical protein JJD97_10070 [Gemmatimonadaceae bacterium]|nr:hypothetical protein [Gemmatimonadaceae bacterium]
MGTAYQTPAMAQEAIDDVLRTLKTSGFEIDPSAKDALTELVTDGFRELSTSRVLDLAGPERTRALSRARTSLDDFVVHWMKIEKANDSTTLTTFGLRTAQDEVCPVYPFG